MTHKSLTVIIPGLAPLLSQELAASLLPKQLKKILKHGKETPDEATLVRHLFRLFSKAKMESNDLPDIAMSGIGSGIRLSPCYLRADRDQLRLFGPEQLALTESEATKLIAFIQPLMPAELTLDTADKWHLALPEAPKADFTALADVVGRAVQPYLPQGDEARDWIRLWNEVQMQLHECPLNEQRASAGKLPVNSVWFWGLGDFEPAINRWNSIAGEQDALFDLARSVNLTVHPLEREVSHLSRGNHLWLLPEFSLEQDIETQLADLEKTVFEPVMAALKWRKTSTASFVFPELARYEITPMSAWKSW